MLLNDSVLCLRPSTNWKGTYAKPTWSQQLDGDEASGECASNCAVASMAVHRVSNDFGDHAPITSTRSDKPIQEGPKTPTAWPSTTRGLSKDQPSTSAHFKERFAAELERSKALPDHVQLQKMLLRLHTLPSTSQAPRFGTVDVWSRRT